MKDHHYGAEWEAYAEMGKITYRVAFSRDGPEGTKRIYVQDLLRLDKEIVWELLGVQRGTLVISGCVFGITGTTAMLTKEAGLTHRSSNKMPAAVRDAVGEAVAECGGMSIQDAAAFVSVMEREGRVIEECWS